MIYLDVTSSCKSPMNTGVQRVVRGLHTSLSALAPVTPLVWDPRLGAYCRLSKREHGFLVDPFGVGGPDRKTSRPLAGDAVPGRRANPVPFLSKWVRTLAHRRNRLDFPGVLRAADTLFVPEIFQDNRVGLLREWARESTARVVTVCHDAIPWRRPEITPALRQEGFLAYLEALADFQAVVAVSMETRDDLLACWRERGLAPSPVVVEPWPVDHAGVARTVVAAKSGARSILCVGTFEPRKNHLVLLEAANRLWTRGVDFELNLVGRTTPQWGGRVETAARALQEQGKPVRWLRHVDDATLRAAYDGCAFTVFPSLVEGFGLPILESLWHGRPCVCGGNGAIGEIARGGGCLVVDQSNPASLATGMERLLTEPGLRDRLASGAAARTFDTWAALAARLLPVLQHSESGTLA